MELDWNRVETGKTAWSSTLFLHGELPLSQHPKRGVSHTPMTGLSHTPMAGVSHTSLGVLKASFFRNKLSDITKGITTD